jgi:hypothetical protein
MGAIDFKPELRHAISEATSCRIATPLSGRTKASGDEPRTQSFYGAHPMFFTIDGLLSDISLARVNGLVKKASFLDGRVTANATVTTKNNQELQLPGAGRVAKCVYRLIT